MHWHEGLFLQPHHLQLMQRRLETDIRSARALLVPYCFGVLESKMSPDDLEDGRIRFERLRAVMPSGQEVFFPEDANLPALDIRAELTRGAGSLDVVLAVPLWTKNRANAFRQGERADARVKLLYIPDEARDVADENTGDNPQTVQVRKINARLARQGEDLSDMETLPLVRVVRTVGDEAGKPRQDPDYVPPSLLLRSSPRLHGMMRDLGAQLNASRKELGVKIAAGNLGMEIKWELTLRLTALNRFCGSLPSVVEQGTVSPFTIYLELRELLGELLALRPERAETTAFDCEPYDHFDPLRSFRELNDKIRREIIVEPGRAPLRVVFAGNPGCLRGTLEPQHFDKPTGYYLGVKTRVDRTQLTIYLRDPNRFKVMSRSTEMLAIYGIPLESVDAPPTELPGQGDLYYFRLVLDQQSQSRWNEIKQEKVISLVWNNAELDLSKSTFTLYMTLPS